MENNTIRPAIFDILRQEVKQPTNQDHAEQRITSIAKDIQNRLENQCRRDKDALTDEVTFARLILRGLYSEEGSDMRRVAEAYVTGDAAPVKTK